MFIGEGINFIYYKSVCVYPKFVTVRLKIPLSINIDV